MSKLIRDKIPELETFQKDKYKIAILEEGEYIEALRDKLLEEYTELKNAKTIDNYYEECGDIISVAIAIAKEAGLEEKELMDIVHEKAERLGTFDRRICIY